MCRIEELYCKAMGIEWAYAGGRLHVLQARPITPYVPLPPEMVTKPGERRRLYVDAALSKGMTINAGRRPFPSFEHTVCSLGAADWVRQKVPRPDAGAHPYDSAQRCGLR